MHLPIQSVEWLTDEQFQFKLDYFIIKCRSMRKCAYFIDATSQNHFARHNDDLWSLNKKLPRKPGHRFEEISTSILKSMPLILEHSIH